MRDPRMTTMKEWNAEPTEERQRRLENTAQGFERLAQGLRDMSAQLGREKESPSGELN